MQEQTAYLRQKANNISIDMSFLKELAQPSNQVDNIKITRANNINNLSQLLKLKNSRYSFSQQTKETGQEWVRKKGGDLNPLMERIKVIKQHVQNKEEQKKSESECHFYMHSLTLDNQKEYVQKNFEFGVFCSVQSIMSTGKEEGNLASRIMKRRRENREFSNQSKIDALPTINLQIRNPRKKEEYIASTKQILANQGGIKGIEWAIKFQIGTKQQFWQIFTSQISSIKTNLSKNKNISNIALTSLKLVQSQFNSTLPSNYESILYYLTNNYLGKMRGQYQSQGSLGPIWGISYMLYRAGRKEDFYRFVEGQDVRLSFEKADLSISEGKPIKLSGIQQNNDLFHDQLIYALKGQAKCSVEALCNPNTLDIVWVFLRNVGIFFEDTQTFLNLRQKLYDSYKSPFITETKIKNLLYLFSYGQLAQIGTNDIMDQDDYLHFLIALYHSPAAGLLFEKQLAFIEKRLTQQLTHNIQQLLLEQRSQYINYIIVMPQKYLADQVSSIIASSQLLQTIDWKFLKNKLSENLYEKLVTMTLQKYISIHQNYLQVAQKQCQLLNSNEKALNCLAEMFVRQIMTEKVNSEESKKAEQVAKDIMRQDKSLQNQFSSLFNFFEEYQILLSLVQQRNQPKLYDFLRQSKFVLVSEQIRYDIKNVLQMLIRYGGFECYIKFVSNTVKAYQITLARMKRINDLQELLSLTLTGLIGILRNEHYSNYANTENATNLIRILQEALQPIQQE